MKIIDRLTCWLGHHDFAILSLAPTDADDDLWHECEARIFCRKCHGASVLYGASVLWYVGNPEGDMADHDVRMKLARAWDYRRNKSKRK